MTRKKSTKDKWLKINRESFTRTLKGFERPNYTLDINGLPRNSIPTGDRIPGACTKQSKPKVQLPEGKTIGIAYNKGCLLYTSPSPRDVEESRMPSSA